MSENCPVCNTPWTETQLITSSIKHCTKCNEKASVIMAKHKKSEKVGYPKIEDTHLKLPEGVRITDGYSIQPRRGFMRTINDEIEAMYQEYRKNMTEKEKEIENTVKNICK